MHGICDDPLCGYDYVDYQFITATSLVILYASLVFVLSYRVTLNIIHSAHHYAAGWLPERCRYYAALVFAPRAANAVTIQWRHANTHKWIAYGAGVLSLSAEVSSWPNTHKKRQYNREIQLMK